MVIGSDGVWEFMDNKEVVRVVTPFFERGDLEGACDCLQQEEPTRTGPTSATLLTTSLS